MNHLMIIFAGVSVSLFLALSWLIFILCKFFFSTNFFQMNDVANTCCTSLFINRFSSTQIIVTSESEKLLRDTNDCWNKTYN